MTKVKLTPNGHKVLAALQKHNIATEDQALFSKGVAELVFMMPSSMSGILGSLYKKGLVEKTSDSPRKYFLTQEGINLVL